jgi:hypothetical protein
MAFGWLDNLGWDSDVLAVPGPTLIHGRDSFLYK